MYLFWQLVGPGLNVCQCVFCVGKSSREPGLNSSVTVHYFHSAHCLLNSSRNLPQSVVKTRLRSWHNYRLSISSRCRYHRVHLPPWLRSLFWVQSISVEITLYVPSIMYNTSIYGTVQGDPSPWFLYSVAINLRSSPGLWAATAASYCQSRPGELPKLIATEYRSPCRYCRFNFSLKIIKL